jgi:hypothetical protein
MSDGGDWHQHGHSGGGKKWLDLGCILKWYQRGLQLDRLYVGIRGECHMCDPEGT